MGRKPCCEKEGLKRGPWSIDEDQKLINFILNNGLQCWRLVPKLAGLARCGKSCRLRWMNYLRPGLKRDALTEAEENQIIELHSQLGNRWSKIAEHFPGRTDNEIKNHWNTRIKRKLKLLGKRDNCDKQESDIQWSHNSIEELKSVDDHDQESNSSQNSSKFGIEESVLTSNAEKLESVINSRSDEVSKEGDDDEHQWNDYVDYMDLLSWDGFSSLDDIFPLENHK